MRVLERHLTTANVLSWPVILGVTVFILAANLGDTSLNGTRNAGDRAVLVVAGQLFFFLGLLLSDWLVVRRVVAAWRWLALLGAIVLFSILRGVLYAEAAWALGLTPNVNLGPRIIGSLTSLTVLLVIFATLYGVIVETTLRRSQLRAVLRRIRELQAEGSRQRERNASLLDQVRRELAQSLAPELLDSPENILTALRSSIDEVIRPLARSLGREEKLYERGVTRHAGALEWRPFARGVLSAAGLQPLSGAIVFALLLVFPLYRVLPLVEALGVLLVASAAIWASTSVLKFVVVRWWHWVQGWSTPVILAISAGLGVLIVSLAMPDEIRGSYELGIFFASVFAGLLAVVIRQAMRESSDMAGIIDQAHADLDWAIARANEVRLSNDRVISAMLHGQAQAVLTAAVLRLQQALRDGVHTHRTSELARQEAHRVSTLIVRENPEIPPLVETLHEVQQIWEGVCRLEFNPDDPTLSRIDDDPICARLCGELILELTTNAIKRGGATAVSVKLAIESARTISVTVTNDGSGIRNGGEGYGSRLLEQSCVSVKQAEEAGITTVEALVPWVGSGALK